MNKVHALLLVAAGIMAAAAGTTLAQDIEEPVLDTSQSATTAPATTESGATAPADTAPTSSENATPTGEDTTVPVPEDTSTEGATSPAPADSSSATGMTVPAPVVVEVGTSGDVLIRGVAESVQPDELTLKSWGGTWTVRTSPTSTVIPGSAGDLSAIAVGDFIGVDGTISIEEPFVVDATLVRNWTKSPYAGSGAVSVTPALMLMMQSSPASVSSASQPGSTEPSFLTNDRLTELLNSLTSNTVVSADDGNTTVSDEDEDDTGDSAEETDEHQEDDTGDASDEDRNEEDEDDTDTSDEDQDASDEDESADDEDREEEDTDTWRGTATDIGTDSFTLTDGNDEFTVEIDDDTEIVDEDDEDMPLFQLDEDSEVRVEGTLTDDDDDEVIEATRVEVQ